MASNTSGKLSGAALRLQQGLAFKRTIIPPMLTCGVLLPGFGLWILSGDQDNPLVGEKWLAIVLLTMGGILLAAAVLTMLQVRHMTRRPDRPNRP